MGHYVVSIRTHAWNLHFSLPSPRTDTVSLFFFFFSFLIPFEGKAALWEQARKSTTDGWEFRLQQ